MRRTVAAVLILVLLLPLAGCYDNRSLERRTSILAVGIDRQEGGKGLEITVHLALPHNMRAAVGGGEGGRGGDQETVLVTTACGLSVSSVFQKLERMAGNPLFFGHTLLIVVGEEVAEKEVKSSLDYFLRNPQFRRKAWLVVAKGRAREILEIQPPLHPISTLYLLQTLEAMAAAQTVPTTTLENFLLSLACPAEQPLAVVLEPAGDKVQLAGLGAFANDRMVGTLNPAELRLFLLTKGRGVGQVELLSPGGELELSYEIFNARSRVIPNFQGDRLTFTVDLWVEGNIIEHQIGAALDDEAFLRHLERRLATKLENDCRKVIGKIQKELKTDIFHFAEIVRARYPHYWRKVNWQEEFPQVPVFVRATAHIRRLGMSRK